MGDHVSSDSLESQRADHRRALAFLLIRGSYIIVALVAAAIVAVGAVIIWNAGADAGKIDKGLGLLNNLVAAIFPMVAAWIGAVIAYYFARENFEAATKGASDLLQGFRSDRLGQISASQVMIPASRITVAKTPADDAQSLKGDILDRIKAKKQGRVVVLSDDGRGRGVFHDGTVLEFLTSAAAAAPIETLTLADILKDETMAEVLAKSVVYVRPEATLADVRNEMERASKDSPKTVRDAFVTQTGKSSEQVVGYLSDVDIAKYGSYG